MAVEFNVHHLESESALVLNPFGNVFLRIRHRFQKVFRDNLGGREIVFQDYIVSDYNLPQIDIPSNALELPSSCSSFLMNALLSFDIDPPLREFLHELTTQESVNLSRGGMGFCLYAIVEVVNVEVVDSEVIKSVIRRAESRIVIEKLRKQRVEMNVHVKHVEGSCAVCLEELKIGDEDDANEIMSMPCSHVFHESCIFQWLEQNNSCPMCRRAVELEPGDFTEFYCNCFLI